MNPWHLLGNLAAWSLIGVLVLFMALIVYAVILSIIRSLRTKRTMQASQDRRITVFAGKRKN